MNSLGKSIKLLLREASKNALYRSRGWFRIDEYCLDVYIRITDRMIGGTTTGTIDVSSIEVDEEERGKGNFSKFMNDIERYGQQLGRNIFVESIMDQDIYNHLKNKGYVETGERCLVKFFDETDVKRITM